MAAVRLTWILALPLAAACGPDETGSLRLRILEDGREVPARVEVLDAQGPIEDETKPGQIEGGLAAEEFINRLLGGR